MSTLHRWVMIAALTFLLGGCHETLPAIQSASITRWSVGKPQGVTQPLTGEQIAGLSAWLQDHRWGWYPVVATYAPDTVIWATHSDGTPSPIRLMRTVLTVGNSQRSLSEAESQELHAILEEPRGIP